MTTTGNGVRTRWAAIGAAIAVSVGAGGLATSFATVSSGEKAVFVPITPCRIMDTRGAPETVGPRPVGLGPGETYSIDVLGAQGNCNVPSDAVGLVMNVVVVNPSGDSYLTVFPGDVAKPLASNLNWVGGQAPLSNAVTTDIGANGKVAFFNAGGNVDVAADVVGYYVDHDHGDVYYTKAEVDAAVNAAIAATTAIRATATASKTLTAGDNYLAVTPTLVAATNLTCSVTTIVQMTTGAAVPVTTLGPYFRNAIFVNGGPGAADLVYGMYLTSNGIIGFQGSLTRTSTFTVTAGQSVRFGVHLGSAPGAWTTGGTYYNANASYDCTPA